MSTKCPPTSKPFSGRVSGLRGSRTRSVTLVQTSMKKKTKKKEETHLTSTGVPHLTSTGVPPDLFIPHWDAL